MNGRRRQLIFSIAILAAVAMVSVALTAYELRVVRTGAASHRAEPGHGQPTLDEDFQRSTLWALAESFLAVLAGGTLLVRATNPVTRQLEQSEARMRAIVSTAGDGIITLDEQGIIESFNLASQRMFALPAAEAIGSPLENMLVIPQALQLRPNQRWDLPALALLSVRHDVIGRRANGERFPVELSASQVRLPDRRLFTVIVRDITERKLADDQTRQHVALLQEAGERLEAKATELARTNRELDDFTYVASHDLKEPLRGIGSYCQILLEDYGEKLDADGQRRLMALVNLCGRLAQLIDDLLAYSQLGRRALDRQDVNLGSVVEDVLQTLGPAIDGRNASVRVLDTLPILACDAFMAGEVFRNLIANGLKFNNSDCPTVEVGCIEGCPPTFWVRDNGIGIPREHHEAIFTMFRRLHPRSKFEGTGAGLTFVRKIIEAHGGRVWLDSAPKYGTTFYFTLAPGEPSERVELAACAAH